MISTKIPSNENVYAIRLSVEIRAALNKLAAAQGIPPRSLARQIISQYLRAAA